MQSLHRICGVSLADRIRNEEIHRMAEDVTVTMKNEKEKRKKNMLVWFEHIERMSDGRMVKKICDGKMSDKRGWGKHWLTFENTVS